MKSRVDCTGIMPYTNDLLRVYQPLRRWTSAFFGDRFNGFRNPLTPKLPEQALPPQAAPFQMPLFRVKDAELATETDPHEVNLSDLTPGAGVHKPQIRLEPMIDCGITRLLRREMGKYSPRDWRRLITSDSMHRLLEQLKAIVAKPAELQNFPEINEYIQSFSHGFGGDQNLVMQSLLNKEARVSGYLLFVTRHNPAQLNELFSTEPPVV